MTQLNSAAIVKHKYLLKHLGIHNINPLYLFKQTTIVLSSNSHSKF